jgi:hypothetical protein
VILNTFNSVPYGLVAECTDDQGTRFSLGQFPG